jgi:hypothetical protein
MTTRTLPQTSADGAAAPTAPRDPIRVVPLHLPRGLSDPLPGIAAPPAPRLTYRGGPLLGAVEVFVIFWGAAWNDPAQADIVTGIQGFFPFVLSSPLLDQMAEYGVPGTPIGHGSYLGSTVLTAPAPRRTVRGQAIQQMLQAEIGQNSALPRPTPNTLYFVYLPPGVAVSQGGSRSCTAFCGYHDHIAAPGGSLYYAAMPYPNCQGCLGGLAPLDALTSTSSHELCEAITDAVPGTGWYDDDHGEIGDICAWKSKKLGDYTVQLEWSNRAGRCL